MSGTTAYEVQGYTGGEWRSLGVCGDSDDAVADAKRLCGSPKYLSIRVSAEIFNEATGKFASRVIYRHSRLAPDQKVPARREHRRPPSVGTPHRPIRNRPTYTQAVFHARAAAPLSDPDSLVDMLVWRLGLVALVGFSLLLAIQHFI